MKIYIPNILPVTLKDKLNKLFSIYEHSKVNKAEIISKDSGIYRIENDNIYFIESSFNTDYELIKDFENIDLLLDKTVSSKIPLKSQLPVNYIFSKFTEIEFKINNKSELTLVIECFEEKNNKNHLFVEELIPFNFYLCYKSDNFDLHNAFLKEDLLNYLSYLLS